ncbi:MAG TPA: YceI family protein [Lacibacter sp.]|nr:YceI family protein [Lacibacter sp.]HMO90493.1 YceI family protein [Lacibacter sp.]HMP87089.1 YceI family protein [Lacibacter sp.]
MKQLFLTLGVSALLFSACQNAPEADQATTSDTQTTGTATGDPYAVDLAASSVSFIGTKPVGQHNGTFAITEGTLYVDGSNLTGGTFVFDINSLKITDKDTNGVAMLTGHLLSPDFFDAAKFGTARFEITGVTTFDSTKATSLLPGATHLVSGNLTLKDSTRNVTFPAVVTLAEGSVSAVADFNIDRTQWGMFYGNDQSLGDKFIRPEVNIKLTISARK